MTDLVKFRIPSDFVVSRLLPTPGELLYGYEHDWISDDDVIAIELAKYTQEVQMTSSEEQLALLLREDIDAVRPLMREMRESIDEGRQGNDSPWLYLALAWLYENRSSYQDPLSVVEMLYADFNYPEEMRSFVPFMPAPRGEPTGTGALLQRWHQYLTRTAEYYRLGPCL